MKRAAPSVLFMALLACGGADEQGRLGGANTEDTSGADGAGDAVEVSDANVSDVGQREDPPADTASSDVGQSELPDRDTSPEDALPCVEAEPSCEGCVFDFRGADPLRPTVRVVGIRNAGGVLEISDATIVDTSPLVRFSESWIGYIERVAPGWTVDAERRAFSRSEAEISIGAGEAFEIEVEFGMLDGGQTGCDDDNACGEVVVEHQRCDGSFATLQIPLRR